MSDLKTLYSDIIRHHNESPFHFEKIEHAPVVLRANNPVCGDRFDLFLTADQKRISALHFHGFGCAISKASASVLVKSLEGRSLHEANNICNEFIHFIDNKPLHAPQELTDDFKAFSGVHNFPERRDCAILPWSAMKTYLESKLGRNN